MSSASSFNTEEEQEDCLDRQINTKTKNLITIGALGSEDSAELKEIKKADRQTKVF